MKKLIMMVMMVVAASTTFAQDALVKEAKKLAGKDYAKAVETITPALTSSETVDKAAAWATLTDIHYKYYSSQRDIELQSQLTKQAYDTLGMNKAAAEALKAAYECEKYDFLPNEKGKVKPRFHAKHQDMLKLVGGNLVNAGLSEYNNRNLEVARDYWMLYLDMPENSLFSDAKDMPQDSFHDDILYYASFVSYQMQDYETAVKYAEKAMKSSNAEVVANSKEILDNAKTQAIVKKYEALNGDAAAQSKFVDEEIAKDPNNDFAWALKGQDLMNSSKWDEAIDAFDHALKIKPDFVQCLFNAGVCLNSKARDLQEQYADKNTGQVKVDDYEKVKAVLAQSLTYLEKSKQLDPTQQAVRWAYPLYQVYYALGDQEKAAEMEKLLNE